MPPPKGFWGIDIGQCALKALRVEMLEGKPTATAFDYVEHPKILSQPDADPDVLIREALEKFLSRNQIRHDEVAIGIAGQSGLARFVKLPPVEEKKIAEIVKFEAKQQIPFPLDEVVWDYQKIAGGDVTDGFAMETEIGLFAMKRDVIGRYLGYFGGAKIEVHCVQMSPLALVNYTTYEVLKKGGTNPPPPDAEPQQEDAPRGKKQCVVVLDIGTEASNLIITDGGKIIWQRPIPLGGNNFTRALTKELKLTFAKAEHLKRNAAKSPELPQILKALKPVLQDFVGEVQRSLGYFTNTHRDAHVSYMVGLGSAFRLPGLQKYLAEKLTLDVRKPTAFARLAGDVILKDPLFVENMLTFPVAYGLALQAIGEARLTTNLLPTEIRTDRLIRAKKPYAAASAAALLLGTAGLALGYGANLASVTNPEIKKAIDGTKSALTASDSQKTAVTTKKGEIDAFQKNVKQIIAGADERLDWPRFEEVFSAALPRPGTTGNLPEPLWRSGDGFKAVGWFQERMREGVKIEDAVRDEQSSYPFDLAMVNIEAVYPRWVDNLQLFFQNADTEVYGDPTANPKRGFGTHIARWMKPEEKEPDGDKGWDKPKILPAKLPDGTDSLGGWIVEIRGYTDHRDGETFIRDALIKNLQRVNDPGTGFADATDKKDTQGSSKIPRYIPGVSDPVKDRVSHAFIYNVWPYSNYQQNVFQFINQSYLDGLAGGLAGGASGGGGMGGLGGRSGLLSGGISGGPGGSSGPGGSTPPPAAAAAGPAWTPLTATSATSAGGGFGGSSKPGLSAGGFSPPPLAGPGSPGGTAPGSAGAAPATSAPDGTVRRRHEFVVMFVWREPIPVVPQTDAGAPSTPSR